MSPSRPARGASRIAAAGLAALLLHGCALLPAAVPAERTASAAAAPAALDVRIDAPADLARLLASHLDLTRLAQIAPGEALDDAELRRLVAATPSQARALLATEGYMAAEVQAEREAGVAPARVTVRVRPGARTRVEQVRLDVRGALAQAADRGDAEARALLDAWRRAWPLRSGQAFVNSAWRDAKSVALATLRAAGYAQASWSETAADVDADQARARLSLVADSGPLFRTGTIDVQGLERQHGNSVRRLAGFSPGTPATEALLLDFQERLQRAGLFEGVSVTLDTDPAQAERATVAVRVRELPLQQATVGVGVSANTGPRVSLEHLHRRAFGLRASLRNKLEWGALRQAWEGELSSHTLPGLYRNLLGGTAERLESDTDVVRSLRLRVGRSHDSSTIDRLWFVEGERVVTDPRPGSAAAQSVGSLVTAGTLNFHGTWRDVDSILLPTDGRTFALQAGAGRVHDSTDGGSGTFGRLHLRAQGWWPLGSSWYAQARFEAGQVFAADAVQVPETQRFRAGGDDSVRGYAYRSLTPQVAGVDVGGRVLGTASVEIARPISAGLPSLWWAAFADAGTAAERWSDYKPVWGAGLGLRWRSPVGPLRADLAYGEAVRQWRLHVSVGIVF
ncbi:MAG TPA: BamA/TamA family outer membrane protein [Burkholderiaceae bacterium]|nr:BamA/TamA family outer membrane protein [Burkholderiaceae bacterium]